MGPPRRTAVRRDQLARVPRRRPPLADRRLIAAQPGQNAGRRSVRPLQYDARRCHQPRLTGRAGGSTEGQRDGDRDGAGRPLSAGRAARTGRHGHDLPSPRQPARSRRRRQAAAAGVRPRPRVRVAVPPGGPERGLAQPPEHRLGLRLRPGRGRAVHRHGAGRGRGPRLDHPPVRRPAAAPGGPDHRRRRPRARGRPRPRDRPPRREARQHPDQPRRPGEGHRLRDRPGDGRGPDDAARDDARVGPLLQPRAGPRRAGRRRVRHLRPRHRPVRGAHRPAAVGRRHRRVGRDGPPRRPDAGPRRPPRRRLARARRDHRKAMAREAEDRWESAERSPTPSRRSSPAPRSRASGRSPARRQPARPGPPRPAPPEPRGAATVGAMSATARANPNAIPYSPDAYAGAPPSTKEPPPSRSRRRSAGRAR